MADKKEKRIDKVKLNNTVEKAVGQIVKRESDIMRRISRLAITHDSVPTHTPVDWLDCFYLYDDGLNKKLYVWISNAWTEI